MIYFSSRKTSDWLPKKVASIIFQNENKGRINWILLITAIMILLMARSWMQFYYWYFLLRRGDISKQIIRKKIFDRA